MSGETTAFDIIVIGGGSGGSGCARRAAGYGAKVALIDRGTVRDAEGRRCVAWQRTADGAGGWSSERGCSPCPNPATPGYLLEPETARIGCELSDQL